MDVGQRVTVEMEGDAACPSGAKGGKRSERVCSREERKRRKTSAAVAAAEEVHAGQQRQLSSSSSASHGSQHPKYPRCRTGVCQGDSGAPPFVVRLSCCFQLCCDPIGSLAGWCVCVCLGVRIEELLSPPVAASRLHLLSFLHLFLLLLLLLLPHSHSHPPRPPPPPSFSSSSRRPQLSSQRPGRCRPTDLPGAEDANAGG